jgi:hypothetical protein
MRLLRNPRGLRAHSHSGGAHGLFPEDTERSVELWLTDGFTVGIREHLDRGRAAELDVTCSTSGRAVLRSGGDAAFEEWLHLPADRTRAAGLALVSWTVEGGALEQAGSGAVVVDERGAVRLRVLAPEAFTASGARVEVALAVAAELAVKVDAAHGDELALQLAAGEDAVTQ